MALDRLGEAAELIDLAAERFDADLLSQVTVFIRQLGSRAEVGNPFWIRAQLELGRCHGVAYRVFGDREALDRLIAVLRRAVAEAAPAEEGRPALLNNLGNAFADRYHDFGDEAALVEAEASFKAALASPALNAFQRPSVVAGLIDVVREQVADNRHHQGAGWLEEAVKFGRTELANVPAGHPVYPTIAANVANLLVDSGGTLAEAEEMLRGALDRSSAASDRSMVLGSLGHVLQLRWSEVDDSGLLDEAISACAEAVRLAAPADNLKSGYLYTLATLYIDRYWHRGDVSALDIAVDHLRTALGAIDPYAVNYSSAVLGLAEALLHRHHADGDERALDESITLRRLAVERAVTAQAGAVALTNLATALVMNYRIRGDHRLIDEAERGLTRALRQIPAGHRERHVALSIMGNVHYERFLATQDAESLDAAERWFRQAVQAAPGRATYVSELGLVLRERFQLTGEQSAARASVGTLREALRLTPPEDRSRDSLLINLGGMLIEVGANAEAVDVLGEAAYFAGAAPGNAATAARRAGRLLARKGDARGALEMYRRAVALLPQVASLAISRRDRENGLGSLAGLAGEAAAAAIEAGDVAEALTIIETARGILLSEQFELRDRGAGLRRVAPELADRLERTRLALNVRHSAPGGETPASTVDALARHRTLTKEFDAVLGEVRGISGFHDFLGPRAIESILADADPGTAVVLVHGALRAHAIIIDSGTYTSVALPGITPDRLARQTEILLEAVQGATDQGASAVQRGAAEARIHAGLEWLWDNVAEPVLAHCGSRVWWVPAGLFAVLPVHAAGYHRAKAGRTVFDRVVSSYAPTVTALGRARRRTIAATAAGCLIVAVPDAPGLNSLPNVGRESQRVAALADPYTLLAGREATREATLRLLPAHRHFHYSGHAASSLTDGASARLLTYDWKTAPLTAADVAELSLAGADLAFLGGCDTALTGIKLADEAVTALAAFHLAGFRHVIGAMWALLDRPQAEVAERVWRHVSRDGPTEVARALNDAVVAQRDRWPLHPSIWAGYAHVGP